jgi:hypothetical protein
MSCSRACFLLGWFSTLRMEVILSSKTSVHILITRRYIREDGNFHNYRCENLKSYDNTILRVSPRSFGTCIAPITVNLTSKEARATSGSASASSVRKNSSVKLCGACIVIADVQPPTLHLQDCTLGRYVPRQASQEADTWRTPIQCRGTARRIFLSRWELQESGSDTFPSPRGTTKHTATICVILNRWNLIFSLFNDAEVNKSIYDVNDWMTEWENTSEVAIAATKKLQSVSRPRFEPGTLQYKTQALLLEPTSSVINNI